MSRTAPAADPPAPELSGPPSLSADGRYVAWLATDEETPQLVLYDVASGAVRRRPAPAAGCRAFAWSHLPGVGLAVAGRTGDERARLHRVELPGGTWTPLGGPAPSHLRVAGLSARRPDHVLLATNARDPARHDFELVSLRTGERTTVLRNRGYAAAYADDLLRPLLVETVGADGSRDLWHGSPARRRLFLHVPAADSLGVRVVRLADGGRTAYLVLPDGPEGTRLVRTARVDGMPARPSTVHSVRRADLTEVHFTASGRPDVVLVEGLRKRSVGLEPGVAAALGRLRGRLGDEPILLERRAGDRLWTVATQRPDSPTEYWLDQPGRDELRRLPIGAPADRPGPVACRVTRVPVRDGARAVTYLTRRAGVTVAPGAPPGPGVLLVHGGPWRRSRWEYAARRVRLASLGLTVVEPNFRGSTGFGSAWVNAGDRQWGAAMQDDLEDVLDWAVHRGYVDPDRIALVGGSYGGYAVLQMAATTRHRPRCVVATAAISDLARFLAELPPYWRTAEPMVLRRIGDPTDPAERERLAAVSPIRHADELARRCPVLLLHGRHDSRVPVGSSAEMFLALARHGADATLAVLPDEGHEVLDPATGRAAEALTARFLGRHLCGRAGAEPPAEPGLRVLRTRPC